MENSLCPKVFVVVLNYNGSKTLTSCLSHVFQSDYPNFEVVVVDNDSTNGSFEKARHDFSRAHLIKNSANVGFAKGNNIGIRYALEKFADFVFVLNNDALIERVTLTSLVNLASKHATAGILSPLIFGPDNQNVWFAGGHIDWLKMRAVHELELQNDQAYESEYLSGCAMLISKDVFEKVGLFDERFFLYYEDTDFSLRAQKAGFKLFLDPKTKIQHLEQSNSENEQKTYWLVLSALIFFKTHTHGWQKIWIYFYLILRKLKNILDLTKSDRLALQVRKAYKDIKKITV